MKYLNNNNNAHHSPSGCALWPLPALTPHPLLASHPSVWGLNGFYSFGLVVMAVLRQGFMCPGDDLEYLLCVCLPHVRIAGMQHHNIDTMQKPHRNEITWWWSFQAWLTSLSRSLLLLCILLHMIKFYFLYDCAVVGMDLIVSICSLLLLASGSTVASRD